MLAYFLPARLFSEMLPHRFIKGKDMVVMQPIEDLPPALAVAHKTRVSQGSQLVRDSGFRDRETLGKITHAAFRNG